MPSNVISALFTKKVDAKQLIPQQLNLFIQAAKSVDRAVMGVEILEH